MDNSIWISLIVFLSTLLTALFGMLFKLCYASKCKVFKCCCLTIERDTDHETSLRNLNLNNNIKIPNIINKNNDNIDL